MELVVDTSIIIAVLCNEEHKNKIIEKTKNFDLVAPHSMHWEIGNALSAMLKQNRITIAQVKMILDQYKKISIRFIDIELDKSLETANKLKIYAYDAYMILCASQYNIELISLDKQLLENAKKMKVKIINILED